MSEVKYRTYVRQSEVEPRAYIVEWNNPDRDVIVNAVDVSPFLSWTSGWTTKEWSNHE